MPAQKGGNRGAVARSAVNDIRIGALAMDVDEQCTVRKLFAYPCNVTTDRLMIVVIKGTCCGRFISCIRRAVGVDVAAAEEGVDATPMEGFDPKALDELLGLSAKGLRSVTIMPLGYRDVANDWLLPLTVVPRR